MSEGKCSGSKCLLPGGQCPFIGVLVLSTDIVDGRPRVLRLRRPSASWLNAQKLFAMAMSLERSQLNSAATICAHKLTNSENLANIGRVLSEITGLEQIVKPEAVSAVRFIHGH